MAIKDGFDKFQCCRAYSIERARIWRVFKGSFTGRSMITRFFQWSFYDLSMITMVSMVATTFALKQYRYSSIELMSLGFLWPSVIWQIFATQQSPSYGLARDVESLLLLSSFKIALSCYLPESVSWCEGDATSEVGKAGRGLPLMLVLLIVFQAMELTKS